MTETETEAPVTDDALMVNVPEPPQPTEKPIPNLLRPHEVEEKQEELKRLERIIDSPPHVKANVDIPAVNKQIHLLRRDLERGIPRPYKGKELDRAAKLEEQLREEITAAMPTQEVMRRNPPGAVDHHMEYEAAFKRKIQMWKMLRLRLQASGSFGKSGRDVANLERYRPRETGGTRGLDASGAQIIGKEFYFPPKINAKNVASDVDKERMRADTAALLASQAAAGDKGAKAALERYLGAAVELDGKGGFEVKAGQTGRK